MSEITAYEKMLKDGSAFKKIDMQRITNQMYSAAESGSGGASKPEAPLGDPVNETSQNGLEEDHTDWSAVDAAMEKRMNALKEKAKGGSTSTNTNTKKPLNESQEITKLKARVKRLEEALIVVMETQEKLLG
jgi:hypothetical protein